MYVPPNKRQPGLKARSAALRAQREAAEANAEAQKAAQARAAMRKVAGA